MLILRIRQAETALKDGRLDEAFQLACSDDVRAHYRGQQMIGRLTRALIERGRAHLAETRWQQALADCEKAGKLGGNLNEAAELRAAINEAMQADQREQHRRADALAAARQHLENGRLSMAEGLLDGMDQDAVKVAALREKAATARTRAEAALDRADAARTRQDWDAAMAALVEARQAHATNNRLDGLVTSVSAEVLRFVRSSIHQGRLDVAGTLVERLARLMGETIEVSELRGVMAQCRQAADRIERGEFRRATEVLRRLNTVLPEAAWIGPSLDALQQTAERLEQVRGGPLGLLMVATGTLPAEPPPGRAALPLNPRHQRPGGADLGETRLTPTPGTATGLPPQFLLQVDGVGGFLVVRGHRVTLGPVSSSQRPDIGLMAEPDAPVITIERNDEDYFLVAQRPVAVNNAPVTRKLLANGDQIALSPRCRMRFVRPNAASTSAMIELHGARLPRGDARRVILMDRSLVLGPGTTAHVRIDQLPEPLVLHLRDERLLCQGNAEVLVNETPVDAAAGIPIGANVRAGPVSFVVTTV
ncbi:MAG: hypothetical protein KA354_03555 [Phycisphaerae bacterium]|nr:hypothetical protein [Phycisphaerae bacterium]